MARVGDDLSVGGMVGALDAGDARQQLRVMPGDMFHQLGLGAGRARDEDFAGIGKRLRDAMQIAFFARNVLCAQRQLLGVVGVEMEDVACL